MNDHFTYNFRTRQLVSTKGSTRFLDSQLAVCYLLSVIHAAERRQRGPAAQLLFLTATN